VITLDEALAAGRGAERPFTCPVHNGDPRSLTASVNVMKGVWYCYRCKAHGTTGEHVPTVDEAIAILAGETKPRIYPEAWLDVFDADHVSPYWVKRVGIDVAARNRCGTDLLTGAPTYPIRDDAGRLVGVVTRHADMDPRYRYPFGVSTSRMLYGYLVRRRPIVLVEGAGDVMALEQAGIDVGLAGVLDAAPLGTFGSGLHYPQIQLLQELAPTLVVLAYDADTAGREAIARDRLQLHDIAPVVSVDWSSVGAKDAGAASQEARARLIERALS
jgi:hypothetical protein